MTFSRYTIDGRINAGVMLGTAQAILIIRNAIRNGSLATPRILRTSGLNRLDTLAGDLYGDGRYWWILAAASDIGWGMQVPPGTVINIPSLEDVKRLVG